MKAISCLLLAASACLADGPKMQITRGQGTTFTVQADGKQVLEFTHTRHYETFFFSLQSEWRAGGMFVHSLRCGVPIKGRVPVYSWVGPAVTNVIVSVPMLNTSPEKPDHSESAQ